MWTSKIDKKIPTRRVFVLSTSLSSTSTMSITAPSAAAAIRFGSAGTIRSGSRKKATVQRNSNRKKNDNHKAKKEAATASSAKNAKIQRASESVWRRMNGVYFRSLEYVGQGIKNQQNPPTLGTTISWALPWVASNQLRK